MFDNCKKVCEGCEHVFNLAADMGGMGFIQSNHSVIFYNNVMISFNMMEAARHCKIQRYTHTLLTPFPLYPSLYCAPPLAYCDPLSIPCIVSRSGSNQ